MEMRNIMTVLVVIYIILSQVFGVIFFIDYVKETESIFKIIFLGPIIAELKGIFWIFFI